MFKKKISNTNHRSVSTKTVNKFEHETLSFLIITISSKFYISLYSRTRIEHGSSPTGTTLARILLFPLRKKKYTEHIISFIYLYLVLSIAIKLTSKPFLLDLIKLHNATLNRFEYKTVFLLLVFWFLSFQFLWKKDPKQILVAISPELFRLLVQRIIS